MTKFFMNPATGNVGERDDWDYTDDNGKEVNAVDLGEVIEVVKDASGDWLEAGSEEETTVIYSYTFYVDFRPKEPDFGKFELKVLAPTDDLAWFHFGGTEFSPFGLPGVGEGEVSEKVEAFLFAGSKEQFEEARKMGFFEDLDD